MRYYIAAYSEPDSEEMDYKESGNERDLYLKFPEINEVIKRYSIKSFGITFASGDRLRIYGVKREMAGIAEESQMYRRKN